MSGWRWKEDTLGLAVRSPAKTRVRLSAGNADELAPEVPPPRRR